MLDIRAKYFLTDLFAECVFLIFVNCDVIGFLHISLCKWVRSCLSHHLILRPLLPVSDPDGSPGKPVLSCWDTLGPHRDYWSGSLLGHVLSHLASQHPESNLGVWLENKHNQTATIYHFSSCWCFKILSSAFMQPDELFQFISRAHYYMLLLPHCWLRRSSISAVMWLQA